MKRFVAGATGVLAVAVLAIGCGGGGGGDATAQVSKAEFIKRAGALCPKIQKRRQDEVAVWEKHPPSAAADGFKEVIAPSMEREAKELEAIGPPAEFGPMIENLTKAGESIARDGIKGLKSSSLKAYKRESAHFQLISC